MNQKLHADITVSRVVPPLPVKPLGGRAAPECAYRAFDDHAGGAGAEVSRRPDLCPANEGGRVWADPAWIANHRAAPAKARTFTLLVSKREIEIRK
jgi:hypothetical protein